MAMRTLEITDTAAVVAVDTGAQRYRWITLQNAGPDTAYLKFDGSAGTLTSSNGIALAKDSLITLAPSSDLVGLFGPVEGVCATGETATLRIQEFNFAAPSES
jgi:hypothetical protein